MVLNTVLMLSSTTSDDASADEDDSCDNWNKVTISSQGIHCFVFVTSNVLYCEIVLRQLV